MFTTGFTLNGAELAEPMSGPTAIWLKQMAVSVDAAICGSIVVCDQSHLYNRFLWAEPSGLLLHYDKRHLFRYAKEDSVYTAGTAKAVMSYNGWKIRPFICYDLRFPGWSMNVDKEYDIAMYVANWPELRARHWNSLLLGRAIENQAYVVGVNRIGQDANGLNYTGNSMIIDPQGRVIAGCGVERNSVTVKIGKFELEEYRKRFPVWKDLS